MFYDANTISLEPPPPPPPLLLTLSEVQVRSAQYAAVQTVMWDLSRLSIKTGGTGLTPHVQMRV